MSSLREPIRKLVQSWLMILTQWWISSSLLSLEIVEKCKMPLLLGIAHIDNPYCQLKQCFWLFKSRDVRFRILILRSTVPQQIESLSFSRINTMVDQLNPEVHVYMYFRLILKIKCNILIGQANAKLHQRGNNSG